MNSLRCVLNKVEMQSMQNGKKLCNLKRSLKILIQDEDK